MTRDPGTQARVVIVDDDRLTRELSRDALESRVRVECCDSAETALESLRREPADLVLSDLQMPGLSGIELLERIRREQPGTEFVLFTANATVESAIGALRMGAADYLIKPVKPEELSRVVERILAGRRLLRENARLRDALETVDSCRTLLRCLDPSEVYAVALDLLLASLSRQRGLGVFRRTSIPMSDGVAFRGFSEGQAEKFRSLLMGPKAVDLDRVTQLAVVGDGVLHEALRAGDVDCGRVLEVPARGRDTEVGALWLFEDEEPFEPEEIARAQLIARHADLALYNAERYHRAKERAFIDDVTEIYNARYLLQATEREIQRAERYEKDLTVLFLDLDRFKLVNDQYGHLVGSQVLRQLSQVLAECIRQVDTLARYGGDEFTILLVDTDHETGLQIAERIRRTVASMLFEGGASSPIRLSISIGVATCPSQAAERDELLDLADKAMYRAKSMGRNCVCSASDLTASPGA